MPAAMTVSDPTQTEPWSALEHRCESLADTSIRSLFDNDPRRFERFSLSAAGLTFDFSKQRTTDETVSLLLDLARTMDIEGHRAAMFAGDAINATESRSVLHVALRDPSDRAYMVNGTDMAPAIAGTRDRITSFAQAVVEGTAKGHTGHAFNRVVNIGIGGSDLGPRCVAMAFNQCGPIMDFVATVDGTALADVLAHADPERTLFIVCSKSFTTQETKANADEARHWLAAALSEEAVAAHFVAVSANVNAAADFGIPEENVFPMWDWVGGRYSLWSAVGLTIAIGCGPEAFDDLLAGAHAMDYHFEKAPLDQNAPVLAGLLSVWNRNFWGTAASAVLPYDHRLRLLPAHLQQVIMESNGKGVAVDGTPLPVASSPIVFGGSGSESQHSFMQLIHQSPMVVPVDFIISLDGQDDPHRDKLIANALAQSQALMDGVPLEEISQESAEKLAPHRVCPGNRPSTTIVLDSLTPETLGALLAFYEHRTFVEGTLWGLNSFDQWGVELGKRLASGLLSDIAAGHARAGHDSSTAGLLTAYLERKKSCRS